MPAYATLNGTITNTGGENCNYRGFEWGYATGYYPYSWTENGSFGTGSFSHQITGLDLSKTVYFRSKAHNTAGWGYGTEKSFNTPAPMLYKFHVPFTRILLRPIAWAKIIRSGAVISLRRPHKPFVTQQEQVSGYT
jgi:hypothetical protein